MIKVNTLELKADRTRNGLSGEELAKRIGISIEGYRKKERGEYDFKPSEIYNIANELNMTLDRVNVVFFGGKLPRG